MFLCVCVGGNGWVGVFECVCVVWVGVVLFDVYVVG